MIYIFLAAAVILCGLFVLVAPVPIDSFFVVMILGFVTGLALGKFRYPHLRQREFIGGDKALIYMTLWGAVLFFINYLSVQGFTEASIVTYVFPFTIGLLISVATVFAYHMGEAPVSLRTAQVLFIISFITSSTMLL